MYPETKNTINYVKKGWHVTVAYIIGFFVMLYVVGWHPHTPHKEQHPTEQSVEIEHVK
jgi:hypothetical protein